MQPQNLFQDLTCLLLPAKKQYCQTQQLAAYQKARELWLSITKRALKEEKNDQLAETLTDAPFIAFDEFATLFYHDNPIGLFMFRWITIDEIKPLFSNSIGEKLLSKLTHTLHENHITKIMTMGNLVVLPNWRRSKIGFGIADMLMHFALTRFLESFAQLLLTTTRNNRSTNSLCYRQGGIKFADNNTVYGAPSDVVVFYRDNVKPHSVNEINLHSKKLWQSKIDGRIHAKENETI